MSSKPTMLIMTAALIFGGAAALQAQQVSPVAAAGIREHSSLKQDIAADRSQIKGLEHQLLLARRTQQSEMVKNHPDSVRVANNRWAVELLQHKIAVARQHLAADEGHEQMSFVLPKAQASLG